jgi:uncharacterized membrane protein
MAFCANCGTEATGRFCPNCGSHIGTTASGSTSTGYSSWQSSTSAAGAGITENVAAALCYLLGFITGIVFLLIAPYRHNRLVRFHAFQSIFASVGLLVVEIILGIVSAMLLAAHAWWLSNTMWLLFRLAVLVGWIYLMFTAYNNRKIKIPVVGDLADKQA